MALSNSQKSWIPEAFGQFVGSIGDFGRSYNSVGEINDTETFRILNNLGYTVEASEDENVDFVVKRGDQVLWQSSFENHDNVMAGIIGHITSDIGTNGVWNPNTQSYTDFDDEDADFTEILTALGMEGWAAQQIEYNTNFADDLKDFSSTDLAAGGFDNSGFLYGSVGTPSEYQSLLDGPTFKEYLDKEYTPGHINAALLAAGSGEEQVQILGKDVIGAGGLNMSYGSLADENLKKAMFQEVIEKRSVEGLSEEDIEFFASLGSPEYETSLNLLELSKNQSLDDAFDNLTNTLADLERAEGLTEEELRDLPNQLRESLLDADTLGEAGQAGLGYAGAATSRAGMSQEAQQAFQMSSNELQEALKSFEISGVRAQAKYDDEIAGIEGKWDRDLLNLGGQIGGEVRGAQDLVDRYITDQVKAVDDATTWRAGGQKKNITNLRTFT